MNKKQHIYKYIIFAVILVFGVSLDQTSKILLDRNPIYHHGGVEVIENFFYLNVIYNPGVAWGMFQDNQVILYVIPIMALGIFTFFLIKSKFESMKMHIIGLSLMIAGSIGNLIDRIRLQYVIDFFEFHFGSYQYPTFNIADTMLVIGVILISIDLLFFEGKRKALEDKKFEDTSEDEINS